MDKKEFSERELYLIDTALTDFINNRKEDFDAGLKPYRDVQKKIWHKIKEG